MKWILGIVLAMQVAQSDNLTPAVTLTQEAWAGYQFYLLSMGSGTGTFAVSPDGRGWGFSYCASGNCGGDNRDLALAKCKERAQFDCIIFALNDRIQVQYSVQ